MKNKLKLFGIIALVAVIGFSFATCGGGDDTPVIFPVTPPNGGGNDGGNTGGTGGGDGGNSGGAGNGGNMTWTVVTNSTFGTSDTDRIIAIAYGNNKFVACGSYGKMAYSSDGITWTAVTDSKLSFIAAIAYGNGMFVAVGQKAYTNIYAAYSSDGITWTAVTDSRVSSIDAIAYGNGKFVARGKFCVLNIEDPSVYDERSMAYTMAYSTSGTSWTRSESIFFDETNDHSSSIAYGNNMFVYSWHDPNTSSISIQTYKIAYSSDGITWNSAPTITFNYNPNIAYGNGIFVAGCWNGDSTGKTATSSDGGVTWISTTTTTKIIDNIAYGGGKFVASVGSFPYKIEMANSSDGITWSPIMDITSWPQLRAIAYGNGRFVAVGYNGFIAYSSGN